MLGWNVLAGVIGLLVWQAGAGSLAVTLWFEGGENGLGGIVDQTPSGYPLLQSEVTGDGDYAFHLGNPGFQPGRFVVDPGVQPLGDTNLYFLSRLGGATPDQVASVELSTNGGGAWETLYSQGGSGYPGEGAFSQRSVPLGDYAGQDVTLRFSLTATGSAYTQTSLDVGWIIDSLQMGDTPEKTRYTIGEPTDNEQLMLEYLNRSRADALVEADRLAASTDPGIQSAMRVFGVTPESLVASFESNVASGLIDQHAQPLAFNETLWQAAALHSQDQLDNAFQGHNSSSNPPEPFQTGDGLGQRINRLGGYSGGLAENAFAYSESVEYGHAGFDIDWGVPSLGHRINIHNDNYQEVGVGIVEGSNGGVGPMIVTEDFGSPSGVAFITGVVFDDLDGDNFYDVGEGRGGVRIDVEGSPYFTMSTESGGYAIPVTDDGAYEVAFSGGGYASYSELVTIEQLRNVKVDYDVQETTPGDFNGDGAVDAADYTVWRDNDSGEFTTADYGAWVQSYGGAWVQSYGTTSEGAATVPEARTSALAGAALLAVAAWRTRRVAGRAAAA